MLGFLVASVLVGIGALVALQLWLDKVLARNGGDFVASEHAFRQAFALVCLFFALVAAGFAAWLFRLAAATRADRRWPPNSMRTSSDVRIRYLTSADALVGRMKAGAFALALAAVALAAWGIWWLRPS